MKIRVGVQHVLEALEGLQAQGRPLLSMLKVPIHQVTGLTS